MSSFCEGVYDLLDPRRRGYIDLRQVDMNKLTTAVAGFTRTVLDECAQQVDPSQVVFKEDVMVRLMTIVEKEWDAVQQPEPMLERSNAVYQPTEVSLIEPASARSSPRGPSSSMHSPMSYIHRSSLMSSAASKMSDNQTYNQLPRSASPVSSDRFLTRVLAQQEMHATMLERMRMERMSSELKTCTFTPSVGHLPAAPYPRLPFERVQPQPSSQDSPVSGQALVQAVNTSFTKSLRDDTNETSFNHIMTSRSMKESVDRLSKPAPRKEFSRAFLMHRINEAEKFWRFGKAC